MPQSHYHTCCAHHHHHHHHHGHQHHHCCSRKRHSSSEAGTESDVPVTKQPLAKELNPDPKKTEERPWTWWMTGDGGQYYYRGRQKPSGEWEYQFMPSHASASQKYSPSSFSTTGSTVSSATTTPLTTASVSSFPRTGSSVTVPTSYAASQISTAMSSMSLYPAGLALASPAAPSAGAMSPPMPATHHQPTSSRAKKQSWPVEDESRHHHHKDRKHVRVTERSYRGHSHHHHHHHHHPHHHRSSSSSSSGKKIGTLVTAEKEKRFSPKSIVSGWLGDVEEGEYEGVW